MRSMLDRIYTLSGALSGALILGITLIIMAQIVGRWFGIVIPSTDDFSGFMLAASSFLGLAYTLKTGGHIRVSLIIQRLPARYRKLQEFFVQFY
jgi:TRAP-type C4-dicarboxylate transport system permease small subunit